MHKKIIFLLLIFLSTQFLYTSAKYIKSKEVLIAKINIDTIIPKIELINIKNTMFKESEKELYNVNVQIKIKETNIKQNNIKNITIKVNDTEIKDYEISQISNSKNEIIYEIKINRLSKKEKIQVTIPKGTIIDSSDNENEEKLIDYRI